MYSHSRILALRLGICLLMFLAPMVAYTYLVPEPWMREEDILYLESVARRYLIYVCLGCLALASAFHLACRRQLSRVVAFEVLVGGVLVLSLTFAGAAIRMSGPPPDHERNPEAPR